MLENDLRTYLKSHADIYPVVQGRIYNLYLPQNCGLPAISFQDVTKQRVHSLGGQSGLATARVQINVWAGNYKDAKETTEIVRIAMNLVNTDMGDTHIGGVTVEDEIDDFEMDEKTGEKLHRTILDFMISYREETS